MSNKQAKTMPVMRSMLKLPLWNILNFAGHSVKAVGVALDKTTAMPQFLNSSVEVGQPLVLNGLRRDHGFQLVDLFAVVLNITCEHFYVSTHTPGEPHPTDQESSQSYQISDPDGRVDGHSHASQSDSCICGGTIGIGLRRYRIERIVNLLVQGLQGRQLGGIGCRRRA